MMRAKFFRGVVDRHSHLTSLPPELREMVVEELGLAHDHINKLPSSYFHY
jgi:hypothetical protein